MLRKTLSIGSELFVLFLIMGCGSMPTKPTVTMCFIDYPRSEGVCGETGAQIESSKDMTYQALESQVMTSSTVRRVPLSTMDKSVCFAPTEWEKVQNYIDLLENYARNRCGGEK